MVRRNIGFEDDCESRSFEAFEREVEGPDDRFCDKA
jgi:hypothetical protein